MEDIVGRMREIYVSGLHVFRVADYTSPSESASNSVKPASASIEILQVFAFVKG